MTHDSLPDMLVLAEKHMSLGEFGRALSTFESVLSQEARHPQALRGKGLALLRMGRRKDALQPMHEALALSQEDDALRDLLARTLYELDRFEDAVKELETLLAHAPHWINSRFGLARILHELGREDDAARHLREILRQKPDYVMAHCALGDYYLSHARDFPAAEKHFRSALELAPDMGDAKQGLAHALLALGRPTEALPLAEAAERAEPHDPRVPLLVARCLAAVGKPHEARVCYARVLPRAKFLPPAARAAAYQGAGVLALDAGDLKEAETFLLASVQALPEAAAPHMFLSVVYAKLGRGSEMRREIEIAKGLDPAIVRETLKTVDP